MPKRTSGSEVEEADEQQLGGLSESDEEEEENKRKKRRKKKEPGDPEFWENCHWCRRETRSEDVVYVKCSRCPVRFCGGCLLRRHGEDVGEEMAENVRWVCPICRGGCGAGCRINCCNCGPCRKYQDLEPAGRIGPAAHKAGFDNVHDYLVHFETGELPEIIARRKDGRGWTKATGAIDASIVLIGNEDSHYASFHWAFKRIRSARRPLSLVSRVNTKWGRSHEPDQPMERCPMDDDQEGLVAPMESPPIFPGETQKTGFTLITRRARSTTRSRARPVDGCDTKLEY